MGKLSNTSHPYKDALHNCNLIYFAMLISNTAAFYNQRTQF